MDMDVELMLDVILSKFVVFVRGVREKFDVDFIEEVCEVKFVDLSVVDVEEDVLVVVELSEGYYMVMNVIDVDVEFDVFKTDVEFGVERMGWMCVYVLISVDYMLRNGLKFVN